MSEAVPSITAQNWPWRNQIAIKKTTTGRHMFDSVISEVYEPHSFHEIFSVLGKLTLNFPSNVINAAKHGMDMEFHTSLLCMGGKRNKVWILIQI